MLGHIFSVVFYHFNWIKLILEYRALYLTQKFTYDFLPAMPIYLLFFVIVCLF